MIKALVIITVQNDFCAFGNMEQIGADRLAEQANLLMPFFSKVIAINFAFPPNHLSFAANHLFRQPGKSMLIKGKEQLLKPIHCVEGSYGAEFPSNLQKEGLDYIQKVGLNSEVDIYSMFRDLEGTENELSESLDRFGVGELYFMGVAGMFFEQSVKEAKLKGFKVFIIDDAVTGPFHQPLIETISVSAIVSQNY